MSTLLVLPAKADDRVRRVQEELRKRNLFFGEVDGRETAEIREAVKRYQVRKGFSPTGDFAAETLASLGIVAPVPAPSSAETWPEEPVLKSDSARELNTAQQAELSAIAEPPPPELPPPAPTPAPPDETATVEKFIRDYLAACETNALQRELAYYDSPLRYFDHGVVKLDFVEKDVRRYYQRWPHRKYTLLSLRVIPKAGAKDEYVARFRIRFAVSSDHARASGETENIFSIRAAEGALKLTSINEVHVRS